MFTKTRFRLALALVISIILLFLGRLGTKSLLTDQSPDAERPEITLQVRQYPGKCHPWKRGAAIRLRLDIDRLRAYNLSSEDVMKGMAESSIISSPRRVDPPPGVVFQTRLWRPEQYDNLILKASAEGDIVRLKDVGKVEVDWSMFYVAHWLFGI
jgi:multidrug efflux pump subunit AcrB